MDPPGCVMSLAATGDKSALSSVDMTGTSHPQTQKRAGLLVPSPRAMSPAESRRDLKTIQLVLQHQSLRISIRLEGGPVMSKEGKKERKRRLDRDTQGRESSWRERERDRATLPWGGAQTKGPGL